MKTIKKTIVIILVFSVLATAACQENKSAAEITSSADYPPTQAEQADIPGACPTTAFLMKTGRLLGNL